MSVKKQSRRYESCHKVINGVEYKLCNTCLDWKQMSKEFYRNPSSKSDGFNPYCKACTKNKAAKWKKENPENVKESRKRLRERDPERVKRHRRVSYEKNAEKEKQRLQNWQKENPDKIKAYNLNRRMNKTHDISFQEWFDCLDFFNNSCAYCGISEYEAIIKDQQNLHKEHVEHDGANDITNCVPACRSCNSSKREYELNEWYNENNHRFTTRRYNKIIKWLLSFAVEKVN